jgi:hypothetical protein
VKAFSKRPPVVGLDTEPPADGGDGGLRPAEFASPLLCESGGLPLGVLRAADRRRSITVTELMPCLLPMLRMLSITVSDLTPRMLLMPRALTMLRVLLVLRTLSATSEESMLCVLAAASGEAVLRLLSATAGEAMLRVLSLF